MLRASLLLFVFTAIFQFLVYHFTDWFSTVSILLSLFIAFLFVMITNFIWRIDWKDIVEVFVREVEDSDKY